MCDPREIASNLPSPVLERSGNHFGMPPVFLFSAKLLQECKSRPGYFAMPYISQNWGEKLINFVEHG